MDSNNPKNPGNNSPDNLDNEWDNLFEQNLDAKKAGQGQPIPPPRSGQTQPEQPTVPQGQSGQPAPDPDSASGFDSTWDKLFDQNLQGQGQSGKPPATDPASFAQQPTQPSAYPSDVFNMPLEQQSYDNLPPPPLSRPDVQPTANYESPFNPPPPPQSPVPPPRRTIPTNPGAQPFENRATGDFSYDNYIYTNQPPEFYDEPPEEVDAEEALNRVQPRSWWERQSPASRAIIVILPAFLIGLGVLFFAVISSLRPAPNSLTPTSSAFISVAAPTSTPIQVTIVATPSPAPPTPPPLPTITPNPNLPTVTPVPTPAPITTTVALPTTQAPPPPPATNTPVPAATPTRAPATNTPVPPTATLTPTRAPATNTPVPPTTVAPTAVLTPTRVPATTAPPTTAPPTTVLVTTPAVTTAPPTTVPATLPRCPTPTPPPTTAPVTGTPPTPTPTPTSTPTLNPSVTPTATPTPTPTPACQP